MQVAGTKSITVHVVEHSETHNYDARIPDTMTKIKLIDQNRLATNVVLKLGHLPLILDSDN